MERSEALDRAGMPAVHDKQCAAQREQDQSEQRAGADAGVGPVEPAGVRGVRGLEEHDLRGVVGAAAVGGVAGVGGPQVLLRRGGASRVDRVGGSQVLSGLRAASIASGERRSCCAMAVGAESAPIARASVAMRVSRWWCMLTPVWFGPPVAVLRCPQVRRAR